MNRLDTKNEEYLFVHSDKNTEEEDDDDDSHHRQIQTRSDYRDEGATDSDLSKRTHSQYVAPSQLNI